MYALHSIGDETRSDAPRYEIIDFDIDSTDFSTQFALVYNTYCAPYRNDISSLADAFRTSNSGDRLNDRKRNRGGGEKADGGGADNTRDSGAADSARSIHVCSVILALPRSVNLTSLLLSVNEENLSRTRGGRSDILIAAAQDEGRDSVSTGMSEMRKFRTDKSASDDAERNWLVQVVRPLDSIWPHLATEGAPKTLHEYRFEVYSLRVIHRRK